MAQSRVPLADASDGEDTTRLVSYIRACWPSRAFRFATLSANGGAVRLRRNLVARVGSGEGPESTHCCRFPHDKGWTEVDPLQPLACVDGNACSCPPSRPSPVTGPSLIRRPERSTAWLGVRRNVSRLARALLFARPYRSAGGNRLSRSRTSAERADRATLSPPCGHRRRAARPLSSAE